MNVQSPRVVKLHGEFDIYNKPALEEALLPVYEAREAVIDFSAVRYMDSTALSVLVLMHKRRMELGFPPACFAGVNESVALILRVSGLQQVWPQYPSTQEALEALRSS